MNSMYAGNGRGVYQDASSTFRFLITTDNHLGYLERDPRRGEDSYTTFEEVLRIGYGLYSNAPSASDVGGEPTTTTNTTTSSSSSNTISPFPCVDAMLLSGDLFHDNKPSLGCLVRVCSLFRKYVFGNKPVEFELLSDPRTHFPTHALPLANFQDPNLNISLPVFAIHGNHDDPVGGTSALDVLATNGCLNYFGLTPSLDAIHVTPILLKKGHTYIALYGIGHVRDERLLRCFRMKKVTFEAPPPIASFLASMHSSQANDGIGSERGTEVHSITGEPSSSTRPTRTSDGRSTTTTSSEGSGGPTWFRLLLMHQNRSSRGSSAILSLDGVEMYSASPTSTSNTTSGASSGPSSATAAAPTSSSFRSQLEPLLEGCDMDLIIWGHEHMQQIQPQVSPYGFDIIQPGSTIRTALPAMYQRHSPGKHCGILEIRGSMYRLIPMELRSIRPLVMRTVELAQAYPQCRTVDAVENVLRQEINSMIIEAEQEQVSRIPPEILQFHPAIKFPLLALAVDFQDASATPFPKPNYYRLGQGYMDVVANPQEMIRQITPVAGRRNGMGGGGGGVGWSIFGGRDREKDQDPEGTGRGKRGNPDDPTGGREEMIPTIPMLQLHDIRAKVAEVFNQHAKDACCLLSEMEVTAAVHAFAEKGEQAAIDERIVELLSGAQKYAFRELQRASLASRSPRGVRGLPLPSGTEVEGGGGGNGGSKGRDPLISSTTSATTAFTATGSGLVGRSSMSSMQPGDGMEDMEENGEVLFSPERIAAAVARHKEVLNKRYAESLQHELREAARLRYREEGMLPEDLEEEAAAAKKENEEVEKPQKGKEESTHHSKSRILTEEEDEFHGTAATRRRIRSGGGGGEVVARRVTPHTKREMEESSFQEDQCRVMLQEVFDIEDDEVEMEEDIGNDAHRRRGGGRGRDAGARPSHPWEREEVVRTSSGGAASLVLPKGEKRHRSAAAATTIASSSSLAHRGEEETMNGEQNVASLLASFDLPPPLFSSSSSLRPPSSVAPSSLHEKEAPKKYKKETKLGGEAGANLVAHQEEEEWMALQEKNQWMRRTAYARSHELLQSSSNGSGYRGRSTGSRGSRPQRDPWMPGEDEGEMMGGEVDEEEGGPASMLEPRVGRGRGRGGGRRTNATSTTTTRRKRSGGGGWEKDEFASLPLQIPGMKSTSFPSRRNEEGGRG